MIQNTIRIRNIMMMQESTTGVYADTEACLIRTDMIGT